VTGDNARSPLTAQWLASLVGEQAALSALAVTAASPSTNTQLIEALAVAPMDWPHMSALVADHQTSGRGRAGRAWETPPGAALTVSFVLRPRLDPARWGLVPLAVGLACVRTLRANGVEALLKWPNDVVVVVEGEEVPGWGPLRKVAGVLCERHDDAVVAGIGVNVSQTEQELPVPHAASLATLGGHRLDRKTLLDVLAHSVAEAIGEAEQAPDGFLADLEPVVFTLGQQVVVERPGELPLSGTAVALAADGALVVRPQTGEDVSVHAGDVRLRLAD